MQANKASDSTTNDLRKYLAQPRAGAENGLGISAQQDVQWLDRTKDLSTIELGDDDNAPSIRKEKPSSESPGAAPGSGGGGGVGGGGFMAFFNCAGKRK
jgi:hypothetical protein